tara:strand:+ start:28592 stop:29497 length:906 start_codon:yes stop_codon:yes gene_type:complete
MPGRKRVPSFQLPSGTTDERDGSYNIGTVGNIFYNTDTSNVEIHHTDPNNSLDWRDLVVNNKEQIDLSGEIVVKNSLRLPTGTTAQRNAHSNIGNIFYNTDTSNVEIYNEYPSNNAAWRNLVHTSIGTTITETILHTYTGSSTKNLNVVMSTSSQLSNYTLAVGDNALYLTLTSTGIWSIQASILVGTAGSDANSKKQIDQFMIGLGDNNEFPNLGGDGLSNRQSGGGVAYSGGAYNSNKNYRTITITYVNNTVNQDIYLFSFIHVRSTENSARQVTTTLSSQPESNFNFMKAIKIAVLPE